MNKILTLFFLIFFNNLLAQTVNELHGLWWITKVSVGNNEMTPNAKWTRFNADFTQQSGNGWFQHSKGTWQFDSDTKKLDVITDNGIIDPYGPFSIYFEGDLLKWSRYEDGEKVIVTLEKGDELPLTYRDQLLGLWGVKEPIGRSAYFSDASNQGDYFHIRWDGKYVVGKEGRKEYGVYNVHGHKPQIEFIPYNDNLPRTFWTITFQDQGFKLTLLNSEEEVSRNFYRINDFPK